MINILSITICLFLAVVGIILLVWLIEPADNGKYVRIVNNGLLLAPTIINHKKYFLLIDTGSTANLVREDLLQKIRYKKTKDKSCITGIDGIEHESDTVEITFSIVGNKFYDIPFVITTNKFDYFDFGDAPEIPIIGIIGTPFLTENNIHIFPNQHQILINKHKKQKTKSNESKSKSSH